MQGSHAYLEEGHHLDFPEQQYPLESPTLNGSYNSKHKNVFKMVVQRKESVCTEVLLQMNTSGGINL